MKEIEDRGLTFKSWKSYAKFLQSEVSHLQQFLNSDRVTAAFEGAKHEVYRSKLKGSNLSAQGHAPGPGESNARELGEGPEGSGADGRKRCMKCRVWGRN